MSTETITHPEIPERTDFSKIKTEVQIPNLIGVQKQSYNRFLQLDLLPSERDDVGLESVFRSFFPITDFRETSSLEYVEYSIGNWACKCGALQGLENLRATCGSCSAKLFTTHLREDEISCPQCGHLNTKVKKVCDTCGDAVSLQLKYDVEECQERGMTFAVPLRVTIRLVVYDKDPDTGARSIRDIKEQEVYFGEVPLMTENGTFIINGTERVIVSQLHRSPGVFFHTANNRTFFHAQIIPYRGSWVEFEYDAKNILYVRIDRKRKFLGTIFLRALGLKTDEEIIRKFYHPVGVVRTGTGLAWKVGPGLAGKRSAKAVTDPSTRTTLVGSGKKITKTAVDNLTKAGIEQVPMNREDLEGAMAAKDIVDLTSGEILLEANQEITPEFLDMLLAEGSDGVDELEVFFPDQEPAGNTLHNTLKKDTLRVSEEALVEIYRRLRPGDPPTLESSQSLFDNMFFKPQKYDFSRVGRLKFNIKLGLNAPLDERILRADDFYRVIDYLMKLRRSIGSVDDIDHLGNRRVRSVGELLENQFRIGLIRMERAIKEKMSVYQEMTTAMPHDLINAKPVMAAVREFFGSSQLSQFMDQTNPLSEITHKRRLSALGPGGLSRERAGFEVRDVHPTHYGRICPIETPEGPNIGLISSLSCYARINEFGFIESPYRKVESGQVVDYVQVTSAGDTRFTLGEKVEKRVLLEENKKVERNGGNPAEHQPFSFYLSAWEEDQYVIAQANAPIAEDGRFVGQRVTARQEGDFVLIDPEKVDFIDVSPKQLVSVAASLIPFLEHDDANRALMGSNMQRQAVPLLRAQAPLVGTGMEFVTARDSGAVVVCQRDGIVDSVDARRIIIRVTGDSRAGKGAKDFGADIYSLTKFKRSNQNTCINQRPIVTQGQRIGKGQVLADGPCTESGELALGRNVLVAFMPWRGYNFEDAILVSEKLVKEDMYTSIHIEEFEIEARETKLGPEEITRDIPNVSEDFLRNLDEAGIVRIGAHVGPGDILVGKVTPKGETQLTPEEKLLRAIFGEKAGDVRDASLITPPGIDGIVVDVKIFSRKGVEKDSRAMSIESEQVARMEKNLADEIRIIKSEGRKKITHAAKGATLGAAIPGTELSRGDTLTEKVLEELDFGQLVGLRLQGGAAIESEIEDIKARTSRQIDILKKLVEEKTQRLKKGDELAPGVIKLVKVYVAMKRKLSVGDKFAGRHGNKGVVARILPEEDMPFLPDGRPVEVVLNPLGVPSRMNVGQILETHLGWAAHELSERYSTPVFDGASESEIKEKLARAELPSSGKTLLYDGRTGDQFEQEVTVGYIYLLKLSHLVDDKIHARSIGPYSLITQQPLGGKAQFGGQRFGEMEVWALESYGAAHILQELLTAKSDDVYGRTKIYEALVKGETAAEPGLPESFNVLIRELQSLCLDVELLKVAEKRES